MKGELIKNLPQSALVEIPTLKESSSTAEDEIQAIKSNNINSRLKPSDFGTKKPTLQLNTDTQNPIHEGMKSPRLLFN